MNTALMAAVLSVMLSNATFAGVAGNGVNIINNKPIENTQTSRITAIIPVNNTFMDTTAADPNGRWMTGQGGYWWQNPDGTWPKNTWAWLDGNHDGVYERYYFLDNGYLAVNRTTPDGYIVNADGAWIVFDQVQTRRESSQSRTGIFAVGMPSTFGLADNSTGIYTDIYEMQQRVIELTNKEREKHGRAPLEEDEALNEVAEIRASELPESWSHQRPDGTSCWSAFMKVDGRFEYGVKEENLAKGNQTPESAVNSWMNSAGHRRNLLNPDVNFIGVGVYESNGTYYCVQEFSEN